jgi:hypothetical protein
MVLLVIFVLHVLAQREGALLHLEREGTHLYGTL